MDHTKIIGELKTIGVDGRKQKLVETLENLAHEYWKQTIRDYVDAVKRIYPDYDESIIFEACKKDNSIWIEMNSSEYYCDRLKVGIMRAGRRVPFYCSSLILPEFAYSLQSYVLAAFGGAAPPPSQRLTDAKNALANAMDGSNLNQQSYVKYGKIRGKVYNWTADEFSKLEPHLEVLRFISKIEEYGEIVTLQEERRNK